MIYQAFMGGGSQRTASLAEGRTTLLISQRLSTVQMADYIVVLDKGRVLEIGNDDELLEHDEVYASMFQHQASGYV